MSSIFDLKTIFMTPLIKVIIKHPKLMESKIFLSAMLVFPEKISKYYDSKIAKSSIAYQAAFTEGLKQIKNDPKMILDLCTGTGFSAFLASRYFPNAAVVAVDQSAEMIKIAKGKVRNTDVDRIKFEIGNAMDLKYEDDAFDLIVTSNAPVYLSEAIHVLNPGGEILVVFSFSGDAFENAKKEISNLLDEKGVSLLKLMNIGKGVFIYGQKRK